MKVMLWDGTRPINFIDQARQVEKDRAFRDEVANELPREVCHGMTIDGVIAKGANINLDESKYVRLLVSWTMERVLRNGWVHEQIRPRGKNKKGVAAGRQILSSNEEKGIPHPIFSRMKLDNNKWQGGMQLWVDENRDSTKPSFRLIAKKGSPCAFGQLTWNKMHFSEEIRLRFEADTAAAPAIPAILRAPEAPRQQLDIFDGFLEQAQQVRQMAMSAQQHGGPSSTLPAEVSFLRTGESLGGDSSGFGVHEHGVEGEGSMQCDDEEDSNESSNQQHGGPSVALPPEVSFSRSGENLGGDASSSDEDEDNSESSARPFKAFVLPFRLENDNSDGDRSQKLQKTSEGSPIASSTEPPMQQVRDYVAMAFMGGMTRDYLEEVTRPVQDDDGVEENEKYAIRIDANHFKLFIDKDRCPVFDTILDEHEQCKKWLQDIGKSAKWVRLQLLKDLDAYVLDLDANVDRMMRHQKTAYQRRTASLHVNYGPIPDRPWLIVMPYPLYHGSLWLIPSRPTHSAPVHNVLKLKPGLLQVDDFVDIVCRCLAPLSISSAVRAEMIQAIRSEPEAIQLVETYGWQLAHRLDKLCAYPTKDAKLGSSFSGYIGFPGSLLHRSPACKGPQLVLTGTFGPTSDDDDRRGPDVPHTVDSFYRKLFELVIGRMEPGEAQSTFIRAYWKGQHGLSYP